MCRTWERPSKGYLASNCFMDLVAFDADFATTTLHIVEDHNL